MIANDEIFKTYESEVRSYCRNFPAIFTTARGSWLTDREGREYLDFFAGAGVLNYGHNNEVLKQPLLDYLRNDNVVHTLDLYSEAKEKFIETFQRAILAPRGYSYKMQFPGPTGTNAVEAALKLARKVTGRERVVSFTNSFHGMTLGSLSVTGNGFKRRGAGVSLQDVVSMPFCGYLDDSMNTIEYMRAMLVDGGSGVDKPAAVILETVQAEGGVNVAGLEWLRRLRDLTQEHGILMIVDDIQVGCGRTGSFFSFEAAGIEPDIVTLSKSLSGYGLPLSMVLIRPEYDLWEPGEHNGTFRGFNPAFVTATAAIERFWENRDLEDEVARKSALVTEELDDMLTARRIPASVRGRGLIVGIEFDDPELAGRVSSACFENGLLIETAGIDDTVLKLLPPLTVSDDELAQGLDVIEESLLAVVDGGRLVAVGAEAAAGSRRELN